MEKKDILKAITKSINDGKGLIRPWHQKDFSEIHYGRSILTVYLALAEDPNPQVVQYLVLSGVNVNLRTKMAPWPRDKDLRVSNATEIYVSKCKKPNVQILRIL